jgi:hypothetical protein
MRASDRAHADAAHSLAAVDAGRAVLFKPLAPDAVRENHGLSHHEVERFAAPASLHVNDGVFALTLQIKEPVNLSLHLRASPHGLALRLQVLREVPEVADILRVRNRERAGLNRLFRHLFIPLVVTEVVAHPDPLKPRIG